jgi:mono/diheme cytochrome c family protein
MNYLLWIKIAMVFVSIPLAVIGFKKSNKILAALSLLLITGSYGLAEVYHGKKAQADNSAIASTDGKALYENNCKMCHGDDGKLGMAGAKNLSTSALDLAAMKEIILHGKGAMPASTLNEVQAKAVADYVTA